MFTSSGNEHKIPFLAMSSNEHGDLFVTGYICVATISGLPYIPGEKENLLTVVNHT
jgi:hypothetical protein